METESKRTDHPVDRKFGRASIDIRPLSAIEAGGAGVAAIILATCGALAAIVLTPVYAIGRMFRSRPPNSQR